MDEMMKEVSRVIFDIFQICNAAISDEEVRRELNIWICQDIKEQKKRYHALLSKIQNPLFVRVFHLALAQYFYPPVYAILHEKTGQGVTIRFALLTVGERTNLSVQELKSSYNFLRKILKTENQIENFLYSELYADERLIMYLMGLDELHEELKKICWLTGGTAERTECCDEEARLAEYILKIPDEKAFVWLDGKLEARKTEMLAKAYAGIGKKLLIVDIARLRACSLEHEMDIWWLLEREILFYECDICYFCEDTATEEDNHFLESLVAKQAGSCGSTGSKLIWAAVDQKPQFYKTMPVSSYTYCVETQQRRNLPDIQTPGLQKMKNTCCMQDMKISLRQRDLLTQFCNCVRYKSMVFRQWGMEEKYPYGRGVTALFAGPPGTGKTMAARAVAQELSVPLYRVDLSTVMDKYIGETEKKLERIFRSCENRDILLFFDEADALFSKRGEVRDSKDRFANASVSYLLQRIEDYDGAVILATNLKNNIDQAFLRRIRYVIPFQMPDEVTRKQIWDSGFSGDIPTKDVDTAFLAKRLELAGGYIKNIIMNAVFMAAGDGGTVTMKHIVRSIENECEKLGMLMDSEIAKAYGEFLTLGR